MDILFVRTKLQASIALNLIETGEISNRFIFIKNFWKNAEEDSHQIQDAYLKISKKAVFTSFFIEANGTTKSTVFIWLLSLIPIITNGKFLFAGINLYSFALVAKFNPFLKINTFDDGSANIRSYSIYFNEEPLPTSKKIGTLIVNKFFKKGAAFYNRQRTLQHFSIYPGKENIVPKSKIKFINLDLSIDDRDTSRLSKVIKPKMRVLIGTTLEHPCNIFSFLKRNFENSFDLVILHPRDLSSLRLWKNAYHFHSIAENIISYLESLSIVTDLEIYHFDSSVTLSLKNSKKINLINVLKKFPIEDENTFNEKENFLVFVDTNPHLTMALEIEKRFSWAKFTYCTNNSEIFNRLNSSRDIYFNNRFEILKMFLWKKEKKFTSILIARVDDLDFQLLYKLLSPLKLYTFDEGLFTIQPHSIYNSQETITKKDGIKKYLSYIFFKFPIPVTYFYKNNNFHFTNFNINNFTKSIIDSKKLRPIKLSNIQQKIKKIFVGQPWQYMYFSEKALDQVTSFINKTSPDIYLIHPRENFSIIDKDIDAGISRIKCHSSSEKFVNQLAADEGVELFTVASTLVVGISNAQIKLIRSQSFDERIIFGQKNLSNTLELEGSKFDIIEID